MCYGKKNNCGEDSQIKSMSKDPSIFFFSQQKYVLVSVLNFVQFLFRSFSPLCPEVCLSKILMMKP